MIKFKFNINKYPLEAVFAACSWFLDKYFVFLDFKIDILEITLKPKGNEKTAKLQEIFFNRLEKARFYLMIDKKNKNLKKYIIKQSLLFIDDTI